MCSHFRLVNVSCLNIRLLSRSKRELSHRKSFGLHLNTNANIKRKSFNSNSSVQTKLQHNFVSHNSGPSSVSVCCITIMHKRKASVFWKLVGVACLCVILYLTMGVGTNLAMAQSRCVPAIHQTTLQRRLITHFSQLIVSKHVRSELVGEF